MTHVSLLRTAQLFLTSMAIALMPAATAVAAAPPAQGVHLTPIGAPTWKPVDVHLFSAPIGTAASGYAEFGVVMETLLPAPNHEWHPALGRGPGAPHSPPYDAELAGGLAAAGYREGVRFNTSEFSNGAGVYLVWMNVPWPGATGSSPDFASGPIIPNGLFPIHVHAITLRNSEMFNPYVTDFNVPPLDDSLDPPFTVDGHSHVPVFIADNADFRLPDSGLKLRGSYDYQIDMIDQAGNGWRVEAHFALAP